MPSIKALEEQIFAKEGFRVRFTPIDPKLRSVPAYEFAYMGSNKWKLSDWKRERLAPYFASFRGVEVLRGDGTLVKSDMRLGNLRDSYFEAHHGEVAPPAPEDSRVVNISSKRRKS